ncbi:hypothetical protein ACZ90_23855 [Streptomyces albus subsp. albus]|nr:hypothetical protein ACZ90_23855 [Streptomyces albus subsp. albus]
MTALRPEREGAPQGAQQPGPYGDEAYGAGDAPAAADDRPDDPAVPGTARPQAGPDPVPGPPPRRRGRHAAAPPGDSGPDPAERAGATSSAGTGAHRAPLPAQQQQPGAEVALVVRRTAAPLPAEEPAEGAGAAGPGGPVAGGPPLAGPLPPERPFPPAERPPTSGSTAAEETLLFRPVRGAGPSPVGSGRVAPEVTAAEQTLLIQPVPRGSGAAPVEETLLIQPVPGSGPAAPGATPAEETLLFRPVRGAGPSPVGSGRVAPEVTAAEQTLLIQPVPRGSGAAPVEETLLIRPVPAAGPTPSAAEETMALRRVEAPGARAGGGGATDVPAVGGRAARRRAAQQAARRGGRRARGGPATPASAEAQGAARRAPRTRVEARRAAKARKGGPGVVISRAIGELFITIGVLMLLFVTYQLWWSNIWAHRIAKEEARKLQQQWAEHSGERGQDTFSPGKGFAIMYIPKLDVKAPIAEGVSKHKVLDRGMVGHYGNGSLKTAMPWDKKGNFALAGHRNTHGEPFRYINQLKPGDKIVVETQRAYFTYEMTRMLPQTPPSNTSVIGPVPPGSGFTGPGRYITLTTCTPEFTSTYRMIVWGKMVEERPRSKGKPDALVGG